MNKTAIRGRKHPRLAAVMDVTVQSGNARPAGAGPRRRLANHRRHSQAVDTAPFLRDILAMAGAAKRSDVNETAWLLMGLGLICCGRYTTGTAPRVEELAGGQPSRRKTGRRWPRVDDIRRHSPSLTTRQGSPPPPRRSHT